MAVTGFFFCTALRILQISETFCINAKAHIINTSLKKKESSIYFTTCLTCNWKGCSMFYLSLVLRSVMMCLDINR